MTIMDVPILRGRTIPYSRINRTTDLNMSMALNYLYKV